MNSLRERWRHLEKADVLAAAILLLAVGVRIWAAWLGRFLIVPDTAVVGLMARHMAEFREFPVFFYGQNYMGSLEPAASAVMVRLLGPSGFAVNLGPVMFAAAALFFLWRWARDAAGPWGGVGALLAAFFGPMVYFQFQVSPRGGYMVALWVTTMSLWAAGRLAARLHAGERISWAPFAGLGILAGGGMWSHMIVISALGTAGLLLLHGMRGRFWRYRREITAGVFGYVIGFSPWLGYNLRHGWASLEMSQMTVPISLRTGLRQAFGRFLMFQNAEIDAVRSALPLILALWVLLPAVAGVGVALARMRRAATRENYAVAAAILFCGLFSIILAKTGFVRINTARYWVPVVPGLAVLTAIACVKAPGRWLRAGMWLALVLLTALQGGQIVQAVRSYYARFKDTDELYQQIGAELSARKVEALLAPLQYYPLNFALGEQVAVSDGRQRFYEPILKRAELAEAVAYAADYKGIEHLLRQHGARWEAIYVSNRSVAANVQRRHMPGEAVQPAPAAIRDAAGRDWLAELTDGDLATAWTAAGAPSATLECEFLVPQDLGFLQLVFAHGMDGTHFDFPQQIRVEVRQEGEWKVILPDSPFVPLEWSGPRLYYTTYLARPEIRVNAGQVEALRIKMDSRPRAKRPWLVAEIIITRSREVDGESYFAASVAQVGQRLQETTPESWIFAPRWLSNRLLVEGWLPENRLAGLAPRVFGGIQGYPRDGAVPTDRTCWFVVEPRWGDLMRKVLAGCPSPWQEEAVGPWLLFVVPAAHPAAESAEERFALQWSGDFLLRR